MREIRGEGNRGGARLQKRLLTEDLVAILEGLAVPCFVVGHEGFVVSSNRACTELVGNAVGRHFEELVAPECLGFVRQRFAERLEGKSGEAIEIDVLTRQGRRVRVRGASVPLRSEGAVVGILGIGWPLEASKEESPSVQVRLTPRQREVLGLLGEGRSTREIAAALGISVETARNHIRSVLRELGSHSRLEAVVTAFRLGLLPDA